MNKLINSPAFESSIMSFQQAVVLSNTLTQSPALESITKLSQQVAESINRLTTSPAFKYSTTGSLQAAYLTLYTMMLNFVFLNELFCSFWEL